MAKIKVYKVLNINSSKLNRWLLYKFNKVDLKCVYTTV